MPEPRRQVVGLAAVLLADSAFNAIPNQWVKDDLDHLGFPEDLRFLLPVVKAASTVGLVGGLRWPRLGRLTAGALVAYFLVAMGFHACAGDRALRCAPAAAMLAWSVVAFRAYPPGSPGGRVSPAAS